MDDSQDIIISFNEIIPPITFWSIYLPNHIIPLTISTCSSQKGGPNLDVFLLFQQGVHGTPAAKIPVRATW